MGNALIKGDTWSWPSLTDPCHLSRNGIIIAQMDDCPHGKVGEREVLKDWGSSTVTAIYHDTGTITFDVSNGSKSFKGIRR